MKLTTTGQGIEKATTLTQVERAKAAYPPCSSTGGTCEIAQGMEDDRPKNGRSQSRGSRPERRSSPKRGRRQFFNAINALEAFTKWLAVGKSLFWRSNWPRNHMDDLFQEVFLRFFGRYVGTRRPVENAGALLTTILLNLIRNGFRHAKPRQLQGADLVDPSSVEAFDAEEREHRKHLIGRILQVASVEERRAAQAFLATGDNHAAVNLLLKQEGNLAPSTQDWIRRHTAYRVAMTRLRRRGRRVLGDNADL